MSISGLSCRFLSLHVSQYQYHLMRNEHRNAPFCKLQLTSAFSIVGHLGYVPQNNPIVAHAELAPPVTFYSPTGAVL